MICKPHMYHNFDLIFFAFCPREYSSLDRNQVTNTISLSTSFSFLDYFFLLYKRPWSLNIHCEPREVLILMPSRESLYRVYIYIYIFIFSSISKIFHPPTLSLNFTFQSSNSSYFQLNYPFSITIFYFRKTGHFSQEKLGLRLISLGSI